MAVWAPNQEGVQQICRLLTEFQNPAADQAQVLSQLEQCTQIPDFNNYLAYIFADGDRFPTEVRQSAGLLLKNNLKSHYAATTEELRQYIKVVLLHAMASPSKPLRQTGGTSVAVIVGVGGLQNWPELIRALTSSLESNDKNSLEGSLDALYKISEDAPAELETEVAGQRPSDAFVPRLLALFKSEHQDAKCLAVAIVNLLALRMPHALSGNLLDQYVMGLFALAHDPSSDVRKVVCTGLVQMLHLQPQKLQSHMTQIIEYMLQSTQEEDEGVALESCEFWSAFCDAAVEPGVLRPFLDRLIPVLLKNMVYDEYDEEVAEAEEAEQAALSGAPQQEEKDQDIKPFIAKTGTHGEADSESDGEEVNRWNLRKCSAAGLDVLSTVFGEELLPIVLPIVQERLKDEDWRARESAILALGAISEGCAQGLLPYLADMINMLLPKVDDPRPLVRSITCWALSRYSHWIVQASRQGIQLAQIQCDAILEGLLKRVLDKNKLVQEAACSALATLEEEAGVDLLPRLQAILTALGEALTHYTRKNLRMLYDALSTLADPLGSAMSDPQLLQLFMPPLIQKWQSFGDEDRDLLPLMEVFAGLACSLGKAFEQFAEPCFRRCEAIMRSQMQPHPDQLANNNHVPDFRNRDFVICSLDLIAGLADGVGAPIAELIAKSGLTDVLIRCCQDQDADVRQSAFALVGDLAKAHAPLLGPVASDIFRLGIAQLEPPAIQQQSMSACNNACWSLGELIVKSTPKEVLPYATALAERLVPILMAPTGSLPRSILENSAITLGRVSMICPDPIAPHLGQFLGVWCGALRNVRDDIEKEHAFLGLFSMLRLNPQGALSAFVPLCQAITSWVKIQCEGLNNDIIQIMQAYKQNFQPWERMLVGLPQAVREKLVKMCHL